MARPKSGKKLITASIQKDIVDKLHELAVAGDRSFSNQVERALRQWLDQQGSKGEKHGS